MNLFGMKKHRIRSLWLLLLLLTCSVTVWAQGSSVTGVSLMKKENCS